MDVKKVKGAVKLTCPIDEAGLIKRALFGRCYFWKYERKECPFIAEDYYKLHDELQAVVG